MKKVNWLLIVLVLIGFVLGNLLGSLFPNTILGFGQTFGLTSPAVLDLGFLQLTFGLTIHFTLAGILGIILAFVIYKFVK